MNSSYPVEPMLDLLKDVVWTAANAGRAVSIRAGGTKDWLGEEVRADAEQATVVDVSGYRGIVDYEPSELVLTARCGTPLADIERVLAEQGQMLAFEAPHCDAIAAWWRAHGGASGRPVLNQATLGGVVAAGLSGPRRASAGAVRDFVLGARLLDGRAQILNFGGRVMKNVAGYDVSRMLAGSLGVLGVILEVSLKVLPRPMEETTLCFELPLAEALERINGWSGRALPVSASAWCVPVPGERNGRLSVRLSGAAAALRHAIATLGGDRLGPEAAQQYWRSVREQTAPFFDTALPIWRLSVPSTTPVEALKGIHGSQMHEWGGALRWFATDTPAKIMRSAALSAGGHATLWRPAIGQARAARMFAPLDPGVLAIHRRLKAEFDPAGIFNRGRLCADL